LSLAELQAENVRCIARAELTLTPGNNLLWGGNGSGKTSLLEAIFLLGRGRSFRTRNSERLIRHGFASLIAFGRTAEPRAQTLGVEVSRSTGTRARVGGAPASSLTELSQVFPVQVIEPGVHRLLEEGGYRRRRWLDWAVFHVEPGFADQWTRYTRALKQRNAALRHQPAQAAAWDAELARSGEWVAEARRDLLDRLKPHWEATAAALSGLPLELHYTRGWAQGVPLSQALKDALSRDLSRGVTHSGPHRGDVLVRLEGRPAREVLSRGQQKLAAIALTLSQLYLLREASQLTPTLLLDDPAAELDEAHLERFIGLVLALKCQLVVTALRADFRVFGPPDAAFHVERGGVRPV
jgi:DNA replication and repair protein RecF